MIWYFRFMRIRVRVSLVLIRQASVLLVRQAKDDRTYWLLPGGGVEYGEAIETALLRELKEETGLEARLLKLLYVCESIAPDGSRHLIHLVFLGEPTGGNLSSAGDAAIKQLAWIKLEDIAGLELRPPLQHELERDYREQFQRSGVVLGKLWV